MSPVRPVAVRSLASCLLREILIARGQLGYIRATLSNQIRGLLKNFTIVHEPERAQRPLLGNNLLKPTADSWCVLLLQNTQIDGGKGMFGH